MKRFTRLALAVGAAVATIGVGYAYDVVAAAPIAQGPGLIDVRVDIRDSKFVLDIIRVRVGSVARVLVVNHDLIAHEFIVGDAAIHSQHQQGSESSHPPVPGEVSVDALDSGVTVYRFDTPGPVVFACHLPGHYEYGMKGTVDVVP